MLDLIDRFLLRENFNHFDEDALDEGSKLWAILTALRGPDSGNEMLKDETTARIRARAFPKATEAALDAESFMSREAFVTGAKFVKGTLPVVTTLDPSQHFEGHIAIAVKALNQMGLGDRKD